MIRFTSSNPIRGNYYAKQHQPFVGVQKLRTIFTTIITLILVLLCNTSIFAQDLDTFEFDLSKVYIDLNSNNRRNFHEDGKTRKTKEEKIQEVKAEYAAKGREISENDIIFLSEEFVQKIKEKARKEREKKGKLDPKYEFVWGKNKNGGDIAAKSLKEESVGSISFQNIVEGTKFNIQSADITIAFLKEEEKGYDYYTVPVLEGGTLTEETIESVKKVKKKGEYIMFKDLIVESGGKKFKVPADFKFTVK